jgi:hypothetical protein
MALFTWVLALELRNVSEISRKSTSSPASLACGPGLFYYSGAQARKGALFGATFGFNSDQCYLLTMLSKQCCLDLFNSTFQRMTSLVFVFLFDCLYFKKLHLDLLWDVCISIRLEKFFNYTNTHLVPLLTKLEIKK